MISEPNYETSKIKKVKICTSSFLHFENNKLQDSSEYYLKILISTNASDKKTYECKAYKSSNFLNSIIDHKFIKKAEQIYLNCSSKFIFIFPIRNLQHKL